MRILAVSAGMQDTINAWRAGRVGRKSGSLHLYSSGHRLWYMAGTVWTEIGRTTKKGEKIACWVAGESYGAALSEFVNAQVNSWKPGCP